MWSGNGVEAVSTPFCCVCRLSIGSLHVARAVANLAIMYWFVRDDMAEEICSQKGMVSEDAEADGRGGDNARDRWIVDGTTVCSRSDRQAATARV